MLDRFGGVHVQPFVCSRSVESFNVCVLGRLAWLNAKQCDLVFDALVDQACPMCSVYKKPLLLKPVSSRGIKIPPATVVFKWRPTRAKAPTLANPSADSS